MGQEGTESSHRAVYKRLGLCLRFYEGTLDGVMKILITSGARREARDRVK